MPATYKPLIDVRPDHWAIVRNILQKQVPQYEVWAFGSRAKWTAKDYSDLDLCIVSDKPLSFSLLGALAEDFSESDLPWKVDVVDWATTSESFRKIMARDKVVVQKAKTGRAMASEWKDCSLGDVVELKRGYDLPQKERMPGDVPLISSSGVTDSHAKAMVKGPGVVTGRYGTLGQMFYVEQDFWPLNTTLYVRDFKGNDPRFISYFLRDVDFFAYSDKAAVPGLNRNHLHQARVRFPTDLTEQRAIARILGTLDDKIEMNRRMNETLEAMARALFKAWFVDFDPVRAKLESRWRRGESLPGLPAHLYDLFPDRLVESELGEIPEEWRIGRITDFLILAYGKSLPAGSRNPGNVPVYGSGGITGFHDVALVDDEAVIVGRKGTVGSLYWEQCPSFPIDTVFYVQPLVPLPFCYYLLESLPLRDMNTDAAVPGLNRENVYRLEVVSPPQALFEEFSAFSRRLRDQIFTLQKESCFLAQLRDTLLSKLISGELRVGDVDKYFGGIA